MAENKDEILANFQACTGIEDVGESFMHLEQTNWDLVKAVNRVIRHDVSNIAAESSPDIEMIEEVKGNSESSKYNRRGSEDDIIVCSGSSNSPLSINEPMVGPSTSNAKERPRILKFVVAYKDRSIIIYLHENQTVIDLKKKLQGETDIPICKQKLSGWKKMPRNDYINLFSLNLASETKLVLCGPEIYPDGQMEANVDSLSCLKLIYTLNIEDENKKVKYSLKFPGTKSILEVKTDVFEITNIPIRHQVWTGWPASLESDSTYLECSGINYPTHSLTVKSSENTEEKKKCKGITRSDDSEDSSAEEFEDATESFTADEEIFVSDMGSRRLQPLIPDMVDDETAGCLHFADEFSNRYGPIHPEFFPGTLDDAIKEACMKPARERRLLAVYLHHDGSVLSNVFCTQLLCCESVIQCLTANFVIWGWDLSFEWNNLKFLESITNSLGGMAAHQIKNIPIERLPAIVIISRIRSITEITAIIQGNVGVNELMASLTEAVDDFTMQQKIEIREEDERTAREMIMFEQDAAYRESLEMDRAKEEAKKQQEIIENQEKERVQQQIREKEAMKEAQRLEVESRLPTEPAEGCGDSVTKIRVRLPKGEFIERRFLTTEPMQDLLDYLIVQGYPSSDYKVISSWPRRDLTSLDSSKTFQELQLCPQETVILEER